MPYYCFKNKKTGKVIERVFGMTPGPPKSIKVDGMVFVHDLRAELPATQARKGWPIECVASGVHPDQADELREHFRKSGLNIPVTNDGDPVYSSNKQQRDGLRCRGMVNKSSYY